MNNYAIDMNQSTDPLSHQETSPFSNKNLRQNFIRKVLGILAFQIVITVAAIILAFKSDTY